MAQERDGGQTREPAALPENQIRMQVADYRELDLTQLPLDLRLPRQERQSCWIVTEQNDLTIGTEAAECASHRFQMCFAQPEPMFLFFRQNVRLEHRQREQRRNHRHERVTAKFQFPKRIEFQLAGRSFPALQPQTAAPAEQ